MTDGYHETASAFLERLKREATEKGWDTPTATSGYIKHTPTPPRCCACYCCRGCACPFRCPPIQFYPWTPTVPYTITCQSTSGLNG